MSSIHVLSFLFFCLFVRPFVCLSVFLSFFFSLPSCKAAYLAISSCESFELSLFPFLFFFAFFVFSCYLALYLAIAVKPSSFLASSIHPFTHKATPSCTLPFIKDVVCPSTGGSQRQGEQLPSGIF